MEKQSINLIKKYKLFYFTNELINTLKHSLNLIGYFGANPNGYNMGVYDSIDSFFKTFFSEQLINLPANYYLIVDEETSIITDINWLAVKRQLLKKIVMDGYFTDNTEVVDRLLAWQNQSDLDVSEDGLSWVSEIDGIGELFEYIKLFSEFPTKNAMVLTRYMSTLSVVQHYEILAESFTNRLLPPLLLKNPFVQEQCQILLVKSTLTKTEEHILLTYADEAIEMKCDRALKMLMELNPSDPNMTNRIGFCFAVLHQTQKNYPLFMEKLFQNDRIKHFISEFGQIIKTLHMLTNCLNLLKLANPIEKNAMVVKFLQRPENQENKISLLKSLCVYLRREAPEFFAYFYQNELLNETRKSIYLQIKSFTKIARIQSIVINAKEIIEDDIKIFKAAMKKNKALYQYASPQLRENEELQNMILSEKRIELDLICYFPIEKRKSVSFLKRLCTEGKELVVSESFVKMLPKELKDDGDFILALIEAEYVRRHCVYIMKHISARLKTDRNFVKNALILAPEVYLDIPHDFQNDSEMLKEILSLPSYQKYGDYCSKQYDLFCLLNEDMRNLCADVCLYTQKLSFIQKLPASHPVFKDEKALLKIFGTWNLYDSPLIQNISPELLAKESFLLAFLVYAPVTYRSLSEELKQTLSIAKIAIKHARGCFKIIYESIPKTVKDDESFNCVLIGEHPGYYRSLPARLRNNPKCILFLYKTVQDRRYAGCNLERYIPKKWVLKENYESQLIQEVTEECLTQSLLDPNVFHERLAQAAKNKRSLPALVSSQSIFKVDDQQSVASKKQRTDEDHSFNSSSSSNS